MCTCVLMDNLKKKKKAITIIFQQKLSISRYFNNNESIEKKQIIKNLQIRLWSGLEKSFSYVTHTQCK